VNADVFTSAVIEQERDMTTDMISVSQCIALSGLGGDEIVLGVTRARRHDELYENYLRNFGKRCAALRDRIVGDIRASLNIGAMRLAADLFIVLRLAFARRLAGSRDGRRRNSKASAQRGAKAAFRSYGRHSARPVAAARGEACVVSERAYILARGAAAGSE
jgi:hypothetical protein